MISKGITILELFSGIGGFSKGLMDAGFTFEKHYYSEIDKHAIANYKYNFPHAQYIGSVTDVRGSELSRPNIITFGSPCQDFSLAGKRAGMAGERSSLITQAIRLIDECRPDIFIWENVKGAFSSNNGADFWGIIQAFTNIGGYRLEWQLLNTSWFLPQNRERIYLVGYLAGSEGSFKGIFPIGEDGFIFNETQGEAQGNGQRFWGNNKPANAISSRYYKDVSECLIQENEVVCAAQRGRNPNNPSDRTTGAPTEQRLEVNSQGTTNTLTSVSKDNLIMIKSNTKSGEEVAREGDTINFSNPNSKTGRGRVGVGVAQTLDTQSNQAVVVKQINPSLESGGQQPYQQNRIYDKDGLSPSIDQGAGRWQIGDYRCDEGFRNREDNNCPTIPARAREDGSGQPLLKNESSIRRLTEIEVERLQGFPDNWTKFGIYERQVWINKKEKTFKIIEDLKEVPKTQRYKMCGNAVTVNVVKAIGKRLMDC